MGKKESERGKERVNGRNRRSNGNRRQKRKEKNPRFLSNNYKYSNTRIFVKAHLATNTHTQLTLLSAHNNQHTASSWWGTSTRVSSTNYSTKYSLSTYADSSFASPPPTNMPAMPSNTTPMSDSPSINLSVIGLLWAGMDPMDFTILLTSGIWIKGGEWRVESGGRTGVAGCGRVAGWRVEGERV